MKTNVSTRLGMLSRDQATMSRGRAALIACAIPAFVVACGFKTNPTEDYKDLRGVRPVGAASPSAPSNLPGSAFAVQVLDRSGQPLAADARLQFEIGKEASYSIQSVVAVPGGNAPHTLAIEGLPAGVSYAPVAGPQPGVQYGTIRGTPAQGSIPCGASEAVAGTMKFRFSLPENAAQNVREYVSASVNPEVAVAFSTSLSTIHPRIGVIEALPATIEGAASVRFKVTLEDVQTDAARFTPTVTVVSPSALVSGGVVIDGARASGLISYADGFTGGAAKQEDGKWKVEFVLNASAITWPSASVSQARVQFALVAMNTCNGARSAPDGKIVTINRAQAR